MGYQLDLADRMRATGLTVVEVDGWRTRGSVTFTPRGSVDHHTAGAPTGNIPSLGILINGRPDLAGPLCNVALARDLTIYVVAAGRANHAGAGGWAGLSGNSSVLGLEVENVGTDAEPITPVQLDAMVRIHAELARGRWSAAKVCQHFEWAPGRKFDFHGIDGPDFRARVQDQIDHPTFSLPPEDDMKTTLVAGPDGRLWTLIVNALHLGKRHVSSPARLADILFLDQVTLGATLVSQTPVNYGADYLAEYPTVGEPAEVHVSMTEDDVNRIAAQVAELAKLSPEEITALAAATVAGLGSALSNS